MNVFANDFLFVGEVGDLFIHEWCGDNLGYMQVNLANFKSSKFDLFLQIEICTPLWIVYISYINLLVPEAHFSERQD